MCDSVNEVKYAAYLKKWLNDIGGNSPGKRSFSLDAIVMALMDAGANANMRPKDGKTILMLAAIDGKPEIVRTLVERGADVNAQEDSYERPASSLSKPFDFNSAKAASILST